MIIKKFPGLRFLVSSATDVIIETLQAAIRQNGQAYFGLSGGMTPQPIYRKLGQLPLETLNWSQIQSYLIDERYVELDSPDSNAAVVKKLIFTQPGKSEFIQNFHYFDTNNSLEECRINYQQQLAKIPSQQLDLTILGVGSDGHFASIFPGFHDFENTDTVLLTQNDQYAVRQRLSLSPSFILRSKKIIILLRGETKKAAFQELVYGNKSIVAFPAHFLKNHPNIELWFNEVE
jgi:6-phosphogluconolactonase